MTIFLENKIMFETLIENKCSKKILADFICFWVNLNQPHRLFESSPYAHQPGRPAQLHETETADTCDGTPGGVGSGGVGWGVAVWGGMGWGWAVRGIGGRRAGQVVAGLIVEASSSM